MIDLGVDRGVDGGISDVVHCGAAGRLELASNHSDWRVGDEVDVLVDPWRLVPPTTSEVGRHPWARAAAVGLAGVALLLNLICIVWPPLRRNDDEPPAEPPPPVRSHLPPSRRYLDYSDIANRM